MDRSIHGNAYRITTEGHHGGRGVARVKTYDDVFEEYEWHPETKCADANGEPANKQTVGLLHRRHIQRWKPRSLSHPQTGSDRERRANWPPSPSRICP